MTRKFLFMSLFSFVLGLLGCSAQQKAFRSVGADEFETIIGRGNVTVLDVRTEEEYAEGHILNALNIDVMNSDFESLCTCLPLDNTIAVYCRSGNRSKKAVEVLLKNGYNVVELSKGIKMWESAGKRINKYKYVPLNEMDEFVAEDGILVRIFCIKHGSVCMQLGDRWLYVDPVGKMIPPATDYSILPKADYILITHEHGDHLDADAISKLTKEGTRIITNRRSNEILGKQSVVMSNGDSILLDNMLKIKAVPAYNNSPDKLQFHPQGRDNGYILTVFGMRIYVAGDTEDIPEMNEIKNVDVAFLPCNLPYTMTPEQCTHAAKMIIPRVLFPYHYGKTEITKVVEMLDGSGVDVRIRQYQ